MASLVWEGLKIPYRFSHNTSVGAEILKRLSETPERILNICYDEETSMTCHETRLASIRIAQNLSTLGFQAGDVVGIMCSNTTYLPAVVYGCLMIGMPINPLDIGFKKDDIKHMFLQTLPKLVICDSNVYQTVKLSLNEMKNDALIITMREPISGVKFIDEILSTTDVEDLFEVPHLGDARQALAAILCSAGTTGLAKGVCISHANILSQLSTYDMSFPFHSLNFSPIYWSIGFLSTIFTAFKPRDTRIMTCQSFSVSLLIHFIHKYEINVFMAAPYQLTLLLQHPDLNPHKFDKVLLFYAIGGFVSESLRKQFETKFPNHPLIIGYGMTEACVTIAVTGPSDDIKGLTVGRVAPNVEVKVIGKNNHAVDIGITGEIYAKPEFPFLGYYNNPTASANAVDADGFLRTGDVGFIDEEGHVFLIDRKKEVMKYKGYQVCTAEIEDVIKSIEGVEMVCVVGIPDKVCTNLPAAVIVKNAEFEDLTEEFIKDYVAEKLPEYNELHGGVYFVDALPIEDDKVQKRFVKVIAIREYKLRHGLEH